MEDGTAYDLVILGAGYAGLMAALRIAGRRPRPARILLINATEHLVERVRLQEQLAQPVAPRIAAIPELLAGRDVAFLRARIAALDADRRVVRVATDAGEREIGFERAIYALGTRIDQETVPGIAEHAYRLDPGDDPRAAAGLRARLSHAGDAELRVLVVGGGATGTEVAGEIKTHWPRLQVTMISRSRAGDFRQGERLARITRAELEALGIRLIDGATVAAVDADGLLTTAGRRIAGDICVWAAGLRAAAIARAAGLATDRQDRVLVDPALRSVSHPHIMAVGDAAHPVAPTGAPYRLSAFVALVSAAHAADALRAALAGRHVRPLSFSTFGQGVAIGRGGVGFPTYPDDRQSVFILRGRVAHGVRDFFVWFLVTLLRLERRFPGFFFWPGRRRISWRRAEDAMKRAVSEDKTERRIAAAGRG